MNWEELPSLIEMRLAWGSKRWISWPPLASRLPWKQPRWPEEEDILFLCGPGNNGGDGFAASCSEFLSGSRIDIIASHGESKTYCSSKARQRAGLEVEIHEWPSIPTGKWSLVVDCLLGAGSSGPETKLRPPISEIVDWARGLGLPVLACDIPTGLGGSNCLVADRTVTFHSRKAGMEASDCGAVIVSELPWTDEVQNCGIGDAYRFPPIALDTRKGDRGRLLIIGGGRSTGPLYCQELLLLGADATWYMWRCLHRL